MDSVLEVQQYYDDHVTQKLEAFINGNARVERAWTTIDQWVPAAPKNILEIGCGVGYICGRMRERWPTAHIVGMDISSKSLEIARKLFEDRQLSFVEGSVVNSMLNERFHLIVLMDVYEHIAEADRFTLHLALQELLHDDGRIILTFPTPRYLAWLRVHEPEEIQPVDEAIGANQVAQMACETDTEVLLYQEVDIWQEGDYAHAVLGRRSAGKFSKNRLNSGDGAQAWIRKVVRFSPVPLIPSQRRRLSLVGSRLGSKYVSSYLRVQLSACMDRVKRNR